MRVEKKQITKEDGRSLIYYHFPATATPEERRVFEEIDAPLTLLMEAEESPNEVRQKSV